MATKQDGPMTIERPKPDPDASAAFARGARLRNSRKGHRPARPMRKYNVTVPCPAKRAPTGEIIAPADDKTIQVEATDDRHAWALACDTLRTWPDPHLGEVQVLGMANAQA